MRTKRTITAAEPRVLTPTPTQVLHPWRTMMRTGLQALVAAITLIPYVVTEANIPVTGMGVQLVAVAMAISKIMALPGMVMFFRRFAPWLAPDGGIQTPAEHGEAARDGTGGHNGATGR